MKERIGIYGGTFDPIHYGHMRVADAICAAFALDRFFFIPAFVPPHKRDRSISTSYHRYAMVVLATLNHSPSTRFSASTIELEAPTRPYTIDTLQRLQSFFPAADLFFVMGADSFAEVNLWREHERLLTEYNIIVAMRPPAEAISVQHLSSKCQSHVVDLRGSKRPDWATLNGPRIFLTDYVAVNIAATEVRAAVRTGQPLDLLVPSEVARYIATYDLYRNDN
ncbi:MAG TPA: nicotinate-nucleotide adenylyltransferase, partial [Blastocatellia bacterium]|nr:nicotinate-nucleotide adenylyltransferase [Blastocatellia bacterium]